MSDGGQAKDAARRIVGVNKPHRGKIAEFISHHVPWLMSVSAFSRIVNMEHLKRDQLVGREAGSEDKSSFSGLVVRFVCIDGGHVYVRNVQQVAQRMRGNRIGQRCLDRAWSNNFLQQHRGLCDGGITQYSSNSENKWCNKC